MGGRGSSFNAVSYQGKQFARIKTEGFTPDQMHEKMQSIKVSKRDSEAVKQIEKIKGNPNANVTIYRATIGDHINSGDWVFLSKAQAERWTKTTFGKPKKGFKVVSANVKARTLIYQGKGLEFGYIGKRRVNK